MRRLGNHAVLNEEKTQEVQKHLGTGWYVYTNSNGSDVLLHDFAGSLRTERIEGSDPNWWDGEDDDDDDEPPKKKRKPRSDRGKHHKRHKHPKGTPGGNGEGAEEDALKEDLPFEKRRGYSLLLHGMRQRYVNGSVELWNALHDAQATGIKTPNTRWMNETVQNQINELEANVQMDKLSKLNSDILAQRLNYKLTPTKIAKLTGHQANVLVPLMDMRRAVMHENKTQFADAYKRLVDNVGQDDAMRILAYMIKIIF